MQEHQITIGEHTFKLPEPFLVLATENPIDQEGTYPLPEAQVDRFMLKLNIGYPTREEERRILDAMASTSPNTQVNAVLKPSDILEARAVIDRLYVDDKVKDYIVDIVTATRKPSLFKLDLDSFVRFGGSPRATIALTLAAKAWAFLSGRGYVTPQDVKTIGMDVLRHRVIITYEAEAEDVTSEDIVKRIFDTVPVP
jgi:MoxR-like ATPase